jgi:DNA-binding MarR family transcriptional regulator
VATRMVKAIPESDRQRSELEASERLRAVIGRLSRRLRPTLAGAGLTPSQISVLFTVVRLGPIGLSELAAIESLNATMLSRITAQLGEAGLIVRSADPDDRRSANVSATAAGKRIRERIHRERTRALGAHVEQLDEEQREALWNALPVLEQLAARLPDRRGRQGSDSGRGGQGGRP